MFPHLRKNLLFLSSRCSSSSSSQVQIRTLLIRFQVRQFSSSPFCKPVGEDEYKVKVSVFWDFNTCPVPSQVSYLKVPPSIIGAARTNGFMGPIQIQAYGNVYQLSDINQRTLFLNGIDLHHIPGGKNGSHRYLKDWISYNPPPAHLFLISGDQDPDFVRMVRHLSLNNYNILFACPGRADDYLCSASTTTLEWSSIVKGEYLIENYFKLVWDVVESFVFTPRGSHIVSISRSREDLALKLQKHGPPFLRCLTENAILQLVELLIAEKKWLVECPSQTFPFRLTLKQFRRAL